MRKRLANGYAIRAIIEARPDLVASRVCIAADISHAHLSNVMADRRPLSEAAIARLALVMGVPIGAISHEVTVCQHDHEQVAA